MGCGSASTACLNWIWVAEIDAACMVKDGRRSPRACHNALASPEPAAPAPSPTLWMSAWWQAERLAALLLAQAVPWPGPWVPGKAWSFRGGRSVPPLPRAHMPSSGQSEPKRFGIHRGLRFRIACTQGAGGLECLAVGAYGALRHRRATRIWRTAL